MAKTVKEILVEYLEQNGYDGLFNDFGQCACLKDDLTPCECISTECEPGYKVEPVEGEAYEEGLRWVVVPDSYASERMDLNKEIEELGKMLIATKKEDKERFSSIVNRLKVLEKLVNFND